MSWVLEHSKNRMPERLPGELSTKGIRNVFLFWGSTAKEVMSWMGDKERKASLSLLHLQRVLFWQSGKNALFHFQHKNHLKARYTFNEVYLIFFLTLPKKGLYLCHRTSALQYRQMAAVHSLLSLKRMRSSKTKTNLYHQHSWIQNDLRKSAFLYYLGQYYYV